MGQTPPSCGHHWPQRGYAEGDECGGNRVPCPPSAEPTPSHYRDQQFITAVWRQRRHPSDKSYPVVNYLDQNPFLCQEQEVAPVYLGGKGRDTGE